MLLVKKVPPKTEKSVMLNQFYDNEKCSKEGKQKRVFFFNFNLDRAMKSRWKMMKIPSRMDHWHFDDADVYSKQFYSSNKN